MERTRGWIWLGAGAAIVGTAVFVLSPWWSIASLAKALQAQDQQRVTLYVDFPRVRASIAAQVKDEMNASLETEADDDSFAVFGAMLGAAVIDRAVDTFVTPDGLSRLMHKTLEERGAMAAAENANRLEVLQSLRSRVDLEWLSLREVRATVRGDSPSEPLIALLERDGLLRWRVVDLDIPNLDR